MRNLLSGLRVLVLEDEYLIAMDVEQLCQDHGAASVLLARRATDAELPAFDAFDVAIIDMMLDGISTLPFAKRLADAGIPFIFASGYGDRGEVAAEFPGVAIIDKPYSGIDLVTAVAAACGRL